MSKALQLCLAQTFAGKSKTQIAADIGYSRPAVSRYMAGTYGSGVEKVEAAIIKAYDRRICPVDGEEKAPAHCRRVALRPRPHGFPDAESLWITCQTCSHKPVFGGEK